MSKRAPRVVGQAVWWVVETLEQRLVLSAAFDVTQLTQMRSAFPNIDGSGVGIAVLDSGVYAQNPDLRSNVSAFYNAVENAVPASISSGSVSGAFDNEGHGTHVSGIAASSNPNIGVAYHAHLVDVKVIPDSGESQLGGDPLLRGLQFVAQYADQFNIKVVNLSLGESDQNGGLNLNSVPQADDVAREIQDLESLGITVVAAAGNSYANDPVPGESYPAVVSTISVASTWADNGAGYNFNVVAWGTPYDNYAAFEQSAAADRFSATSQRSTMPNQVAAPGVNIFSTWNNSASSTSNLLYNTLSGTSMAAPFVSGVVALMQEAAFTYGGRYFSDPNQIRQIIQQTSDVITDSNVTDNGRVPLVNGQPNTSQVLPLPETGLTYDRVNVLRAIQFVKQLFTGGGISTSDLDNTTSTATAIPALTGTRTFNGRGSIGTDGLNNVGPNDVDLYKLTLSSPGSLTASLSLPTGGTAFPAVIRLFDASGNQIAVQAGTNSAYPTLTTDPQNPLAVGTYYVGISSNGNVTYGINGTGATNGTATGDYLLALSLSNPDPNGVAQGAVPVDLTNPDSMYLTSTTLTANKYTGSIGSDPPPAGSSTRVQVPNGDVDMFKVVAPDSGVLNVRTDTSAYFGQAADTYVRVFDANLNQVAFNDDISQFTTDSYVQVPVQAGQVYYVAVTNYANRAFDPVNPYGRAANSSPTDQLYDLYLNFSNGDQNGTALAATTASVGTTVNDAIGSDGGTALSGAGGGNKDVDFYVYTAPTDGLLDLSTTASVSSFTPTFQLWSLTNGNTSIDQVAQATGSGSHLIEQVTAGQTVYVSVTGKGNENFNWYSVASGTGGQTGPYSLASAMRPITDLQTLSDNSISNGTPETLTLNTPVFANLGQDGPLVVGPTDVDMYKLTVPETATYDIATDTSREGSADTVLRLFDAAGNQITVNDNASAATTSSLIRVRLTAGTTYYVGVSGAGAGATAYDPVTGANAQVGSTGIYGLEVVRSAQQISQVVTFSARKSATYTDSNGHKVTLRLSGSGNGTATFMGSSANPASIVLAGTKATTVFSVTPNRGVTTLGDLSDAAALGAIQAGAAVMTGTVSLASVSTLTTAAVTGGTWTIGGNVASMIVKSTGSTWAASVSGKVGSLAVAGTLSGSISARSIASLTAGAMSSATVRTTGTGAGSMGTVAVRGAVSNSQVRAAGSIGVFRSATLIDSRVFAGVSDAVSGLPASAADLVANATIGAVSVTGGGSKSSPFAVHGSDVAAASIGSVLFARVDPDNAGDPFGVAAKKLARYTRRVGKKTLTALPKPGQTLSDGGDAVVRRLA